MFIYRVLALVTVSSFVIFIEMSMGFQSTYVFKALCNKNANCTGFCIAASIEDKNCDLGRRCISYKATNDVAIKICGDTGVATDECTYGGDTDQEVTCTGCMWNDCDCVKKPGTTQTCTSCGCGTLPNGPINIGIHLPCLSP